jgi:hypothetical protein
MPIAAATPMKPIGDVDRRDEYKLEQRKRYTVLPRAGVDLAWRSSAMFPSPTVSVVFLPMVQNLEIRR